LITGPAGVAKENPDGDLSVAQLKVFFFPDLMDLHKTPLTGTGVFKAAR